MKRNEKKNKRKETNTCVWCVSVLKGKKSPAAAYRKVFSINLTMKIIGAAFGPIEKQKKTSTSYLTL